jgi:hypothetical protein
VRDLEAAAGGQASRLSQRSDLGQGDAGTRVTADDDRAVAHVQIRDITLQDPGGKLDGPLPDRRRGLVHRAATYHCGPGGPGPGAERLGVRVTGNDADDPGVDAERVRRDLGQHGLDALADRGAAGVHVDRAGPAHGHIRGLLRPETALLHEQG